MSAPDPQQVADAGASDTALAGVVLGDVADLVWEGLLGEPVDVVPAEPLTGEEVSAQVAVHGPWSGVVTLSASRAAVEALTRALLRPVVPDVPRGAPDVLDDEDVEDAFGEVTNVLGGTVKSLLPGPSRLGLPEVGCAPPAPHSTGIGAGVHWRDHLLTITVRPAHTGETALAAPRAGSPGAPLEVPTTARAGAPEKDEVLL